MSFMPNDIETWVRTTGNNPVQIADDTYFVKTRTHNTGNKKVTTVHIPIQAVENMKLVEGATYILHMKRITTGKKYDAFVQLKKWVVKNELNRWPLYGIIDKSTNVESGWKLYAKIEMACIEQWHKQKAVPIKEWFDSDDEVPMPDVDIPEDKLKDLYRLTVDDEALDEYEKVYD